MAHALDRIWDRDDGTRLATAEVTVPASFAGWVSFPFGARVPADKPVRFAIGAAPGTSWAHCADQPVGTMAMVRHAGTGGPHRPENLRYPVFQPDQTDLPAFTSWNESKWFSLATRIVPESRPFPASNAVNGVLGPIDGPNLWIGDPGRGFPQALDVELLEPAETDRVHLTFDTGLNLRYRDLPGLWRAPTCPSHFRVCALVGGKWRMLHERRENYLRHHVITFAPVTASALRVEFLAGQPGTAPGVATAARLYELRAYGPR